MSVRPPPQPHCGRQRASRLRGFAGGGCAYLPPAIPAPHRPDGSLQSYRPGAASGVSRREVGPITAWAAWCVGVQCPGGAAVAPVGHGQPGIGSGAAHPQPHALAVPPVLCSRRSWTRPFGWPPTTRHWCSMSRYWRCLYSPQMQSWPTTFGPNCAGPLSDRRGVEVPDQPGTTRTTPFLPAFLLASSGSPSTCSAGPTGSA